MRVEIVAVGDRGVPNKERLHLRVLVNMNLSYLMLITSRYQSPTAITANLQQAFWFPPKDVKVGDNVIIFTGAGAVTEEKGPDGSTNHFYHWGLGKTILADPAACIVVVDISTWKTTPRVT